MTEHPHSPEPLPEKSPVERLIDRIEFLILSDESLTVVETVGALQMIATRIATAALADDDG